MAATSAAARLLGALRSAGVDALLIKGPVTEHWLYHGESRPYGDLDVIVRPRDFNRAERTLHGLGYVSRYDGDAPEWLEEHADRWSSESELFPIDLHRRVWGLDVGSDVAWEQFWPNRETWNLDGQEVVVPGLHTRLLLLALHAAHHPGVEKPEIDLGRALQRHDLSEWRATVALADDLGATSGLAAGLEPLDPAGTFRASVGLGQTVPRMPEVSPTLWRLPKTGEGVLRVAEAASWGARAGLLRRELFPSAAFMRERSAYRDLAARGRLGLARAHVRRWAALAPHLPAGTRAAMSERRDRRRH